MVLQGKITWNLVSIALMIKSGSGSFFSGNLVSIALRQLQNTNRVLKTEILNELFGRNGRYRKSRRSLLILTFHESKRNKRDCIQYVESLIFSILRQQKHVFCCCKINKLLNQY